MEEYEREKLEEMLEAITLAGSADQIKEEVDELNRLAEKAQAVEDSGTEAKLSRLKDLLQQQGFSIIRTGGFSSLPSSKTPRLPVGRVKRLGI